MEKEQYKKCQEIMATYLSGTLSDALKDQNYRKKIDTLEEILKVYERNIEQILNEYMEEAFEESPKTDIIKSMFEKKITKEFKNDELSLGNILKKISNSKEDKPKPNMMVKAVEAGAKNLLAVFSNKQNKSFFKQASSIRPQKRQELQAEKIKEE